jgi:L-lactate permease
MDGIRGCKETWPALLISGGSYAISQFIIVNTIIVTIWSLNAFKSLFAGDGLLASWVINVPVPYLHNLVIKSGPIVPKPTPYEAILKLDLLSATGTAILLTAVISCFIFKFKPTAAVSLLGEVVKELILPIVTICAVLAFAFVANDSGISSTLGLAVANTGKWFPFFSPFLGLLGVFLTGSVMSSNALFGTPQSNTAHQIGVNSTLLVAANVVGVVTAKMLSPQSIAVASAAVNLPGQEIKLFRFTYGWCGTASGRITH